MSELTTGATDEQIDAAVTRANDAWEYGEGLPSILGPEVRGAVQYLVPPGYRIVPEREVLTPEMRQAVRWATNVLGTVDREYDVTELFQDAHNYFPAADGGNVERHIETLRAIAQGGSNDAV